MEQADKTPLLPEIDGWSSIRRYDKRPIPDTVLRRILESARRAPSWGNVQPWHFIVVRNPARKELLKELAFGQKFVATADAVILCLGDFWAWKDRDKRIDQLKELVSVLSSAHGRDIDQHVLEAYLDDPTVNPALKGTEVLIARQFEQLSLAIAFMGLQAKHEGVGSCIIGGFSNDLTGGNMELYTQVLAEFKIPNELILLSMVTLGYPLETPKPRPRKPFDEVVSSEWFGVPF